MGVQLAVNMGYNKLLCSFIFVLGFSNVYVDGCTTSVTGLTFDFNVETDTLMPGLPTATECEAECIKSETCQAYTFEPIEPVPLCFLFNNMSSMVACEHTSCNTGSVTRIIADMYCPVDHDDLIDDVTTTDSAECLQQCKNIDECKQFVFLNEGHMLPNSCLLYSSECQNLSECSNCESGQLMCLENPLPSQCSKYAVLDDKSRNVNNGQGDYSDNSDHRHTSPDWQGQQWYRMMAPAGKFIPEKTPGYGHCGSRGAGFMKQPHPANIGDTESVYICFDETGADDNMCEYGEEIQVTKCGVDMFVYLLNEVTLDHHHHDSPHLRYCSTDDI